MIQLHGSRYINGGIGFLSRDPKLYVTPVLRSGTDWADCISIQGDQATAFFPSDNNAKAKAGFYLPDLSYFGKLRDIKFRARAPRELINFVEK